MFILLDLGWWGRVRIVFEFVGGLGVVFECFRVGGWESCVRWFFILDGYFVFCEICSFILGNDK